MSVDSKGNSLEVGDYVLVEQAAFASMGMGTTRVLQVVNVRETYIICHYSRGWGGNGEKCWNVNSPNIKIKIPEYLIASKNINSIKLFCSLQGFALYNDSCVELNEKDNVE